MRRLVVADLHQALVQNGKEVSLNSRGHFGRIFAQELWLLLREWNGDFDGVVCRPFEEDKELKCE